MSNRMLYCLRLSSSRCDMLSMDRNENRLVGQRNAMVPSAETWSGRLVIDDLGPYKCFQSWM